MEYSEKDFRTYEELRSTVIRWAINKKIEKERFIQGDPMDTNEAEEQHSAEDWKYWDTGWPSEEIEGETEDID